MPGFRFRFWSRLRAISTIQYALLLGLVSLMGAGAVTGAGSQLSAGLDRVAQRIRPEPGCPAQTLAPGYNVPEMTHGETRPLYRQVSFDRGSDEYAAEVECRSGQLILGPEQRQRRVCNDPLVLVGDSCEDPVYRVSLWGPWSGPDSLPACSGTESQTRNPIICINQLDFTVPVSLCSAETRQVQSQAGTLACSPQPQGSTGGTQACAAGSSTRGPCTGFTCSGGLFPVGEQCLPFTFAWTTGGWSGCSNSCGSGSRTRSVSCQRSDGASAEDSFCTAPRPAGSESCSETGGCSYTWASSSFGGCSNSCGGGTAYRSVWCQRSDGANMGDTTAYPGCSAGARPSTATGCSEYGGCSYFWNTGGWGGCNLSCGWGSQSRSVWCQRSDGTSMGDSSAYPGCSAGARPASSQSCYAGECYSYSWATGGWSGCSNCGSQSRSVYCRRSDGANMGDNSGFPGCSAGSRPSSSQACPCTWYLGWQVVDGPNIGYWHARNVQSSSPVCGHSSNCACGASGYHCGNYSAGATTIMCAGPLQRIQCIATTSPH